MFSADKKNRFDDKYRFGNFTINEQYVIFWNNFRIFYFDIDDIKGTDWQKLDLQDISLIVDPDNTDTWVVKVRAGSNPNEVAIGINQSVTKDCIIIWDIESNCEISSIDVGKEAKIFYDS